MKARRIGQSHTIHLEWHFKSPNIFVHSRDHTRVIWKTKLCCVYINNMIDPTNDPWTSFLIPFINLHCTLLHQMNMHLQSIPQHMRFMSHFHGKYIHPKHDHNTVTIRDSLSIYIRRRRRKSFSHLMEHIFKIGMSTLFDDERSTFAWCQST